jgi:hypothetical protein
MGHTVEARVHPNVVEVRYRNQVVQTMPRLRKEDAHRIDYRHVIGWLAGAQARRVCAVSVSRRPLSLGHIPARLRRVGADARRARRH